jgi:lysophospholipase L1-like esterase
MRLLVYGDSNSWGYLDDASGQRFDGRWPRQMAESYAARCTPDHTPIDLIEENLPGRITHGTDPLEGPQYDGAAPLLAILMSHQPLDRVLIMLGTNDLKARFDRSADDIAEGVLRLVDIVGASLSGPGGWHGETSPAVTVICPPMLGARVDDDQWIRYEEWRGGLEKSQMLPAALGRVCHDRGIDFINANDAAVSSDRDPIHWRAETHTAFGDMVAAHLLNLT